MSELEEQLLHTHQTGISKGLRQAAEYIMVAAKDSFERFGAEERQTARLRYLAQQLHTMANKAHPGDPVVVDGEGVKDNSYPPILDALSAGGCAVHRVILGKEPSVLIVRRSDVPLK